MIDFFHEKPKGFLLGFFCSSIGKKAVMAVTGLMLLGFVIVHMLGNLQIFLGPEWLNGYAEHLVSLPLLLWPARAILLTAFLVHIVTAILLAIENKKARPIGYRKKNSVQTTTASVTMTLTGGFIFIFVVYHLLHFTFGKTNPEFYHLLDAKGRHDVYRMVVLSFQNYWIAGGYILAMGFLGMHLSHGAPRFLQTLGLADESTRSCFERAGWVLAWALALGNAVIPIAVLAGWVSPQGVFL